MKLKWTQQQLSDASGVSKSFISEIENNSSSPRVDILVKIANTLNVSLDYLVLGKDPMTNIRGTRVITEEQYKWYRSQIIKEIYNAGDQVYRSKREIKSGESGVEFWGDYLNRLKNIRDDNKEG
jgi:transcriptional regulator with XRE-family HTH domain